MPKTKQDDKKKCMKTKKIKTAFFVVIILFAGM